MKRKIFAGMMMISIVLETACSCNSYVPYEGDKKNVESGTDTEKKVKETESGAEKKEITESGSVDNDKTKDETPVPEKKETVDVKEWSQAYIDLIADMYGDENKFGFAYINDDDIPEIVWLCEDVEEFGFGLYNIFSYHDGAVYREYPYSCGSLSYIEKKNRIKISEYITDQSDQDYIFDIIYDLKFHCLADSDSSSSALSSSIASGYYYFDDECTWENKTMSAEQYEKKLDAVFDTSVAKNADTNYDADGIISALKALQNGQNDNLPEWKQAYLNYIIIMYPDVLFQLVDFNNDNTPEMCVDLSGSTGVFEILGYHNGEIKRSVVMRFLSYDENGLYGEAPSAGGGGSYGVAIYDFIDGAAVEREFGYCDYAFDGTDYADKATYTWNDKKVSEKEFNRLKKEAFGSNKKKDILEGFLRKDEMISILGSIY